MIQRAYEHPTAGVAPLLLTILFLIGCAKPLNQTTSDRYRNDCLESEAAGRLDIAEEACYRALINVRIGRLGAEAEAQELYNLGRIKRKLKKYEEAEELYKDSLRIQASISPVDQVKIGRRLAEFAILYAAQRRFDDGLPFVMKLLPIADSSVGSERKSMAAIFGIYANALSKTNSPGPASILAKKAAEMGFDPKQLTQ